MRVRAAAAAHMQPRVTLHFACDHTCVLRMECDTAGRAVGAGEGGVGDPPALRRTHIVECHTWVSPPYGHWPGGAHPRRSSTRACGERERARFHADERRAERSLEGKGRVGREGVACDALGRLVRANCACLLSSCPLTYDDDSREHSRMPRPYPERVAVYRSVKPF